MKFRHIEADVIRDRGDDDFHRTGLPPGRPKTPEERERAIARFLEGDAEPEGEQEEKPLTPELVRRQIEFLRLIKAPEDVIQEKFSLLAKLEARAGKGGEKW